MTHHNETSESIFIQPIDQKYSQENYEKENELLYSQFNLLSELKFYDDLFEDDKVNSTSYNIKVNFRKRKNKFRLILKPRWKEKISLMKTNSFIYMKNFIAMKIASNKHLYTM